MDEGRDNAKIKEDTVNCATRANGVGKVSCRRTSSLHRCVRRRIYHGNVSHKTFCEDLPEFFVIPELLPLESLFLSTCPLSLNVIAWIVNAIAVDLEREHNRYDAKWECWLWKDMTTPKKERELTCARSCSLPYSN